MSVRSARYNLLSLRNPKGLTVIPEERDAWAFLDAAKITSSREQRAVIELVRGLKNAQLWSKMKAIYPFVGGTATTHKFNLKDPRDSNAAYRLTFAGGWTHNSNGITGNGTNSNANANGNPAAMVGENSSHIGIYSRTNNTGAYYDISSYDSNTAFAHDIYIRNASNLCEMLSYKFPDNNISLTVTNSSGLFINTRSASNSHKAFRNATVLGSSTAAPVGFSNLTTNYSIGAPAGAGANVSNRNYAFATIGDGLTDADATALYNIVQRFQTSLGRQV